jgi:single-strand DNA-binding protein
MNVLVIAGNIGKDAKINQVQTSTGFINVANFSVAVATMKKDPATGKPISQWFDCALWGDRADKIAQFLTAGTKVCVTGEVGVDSYQDGQGVMKPKLTVRVGNVTLQGSPNQQQGQQQAQPMQQQRQQPAQQQQPQQGYQYNHQQAQQPQNAGVFNEPPMDWDDQMPF